MGLNDTPLSSRVQIGFFGSVNAGKSSLINAITGQKVAIVSDTEGTTTDPVIKTMELAEAGPVAFIDTAGFDDTGELGHLRTEATLKTLNRVDVAVIVETPQKRNASENIVELCKEKNIPYIKVINKSDTACSNADSGICVSALTGEGILNLKEILIEKIKQAQVLKKENKLVSDIVKTNDNVLLVVPIDKAAPKGRLILPQQQVIRDVLESGAKAIVIRDKELKENFENGSLANVNLVITDSQVFKMVDEIVPENIPLTSFSVLMARYNGFLDYAVEGVREIDNLNDGDKILISEACTHHRHCEDIGTVKIPALLKKYTGKTFEFDVSVGNDFPEDLSQYKLVIHCGGCMLNENQMRSRMNYVSESGTKVTNYGVAIAYMSGILKRAVAPIHEIEL